MINICCINPKYTKAAISNRAVISGIAGLRKAYFVEKKNERKTRFSKWLRAYFSRPCTHGSCPSNWPFGSRLVVYWNTLLLRFDLHKIIAGIEQKNCESWAVACYRRLAHKSNNEKSDFYQVGLSVISYIGLCIRASESTFDRYPIFSSKTVEGITRESYRTIFSWKPCLSWRSFWGHVFLCHWLTYWKFSLFLALKIS